MKASKKQAPKTSATRDSRPVGIDMMRFESGVRAHGFVRIAGVDEAGRGPLAGPIVAGAAILHCPVDGLNDSKLLTEERREYLFSRLADEAHTTGIALVDAAEIDRIGIQAANYKVMLDAVAQLPAPPDFLLVDGFSIPGCVIPHQRIVKGDRLSQSIAAASILAKVTRDRIMLELDRLYPDYGFARHKGYATREHLDALRKHGPCPIHRRSFAPMSERRQLNMPFAGTR